MNKKRFKLALVELGVPADGLARKIGIDRATLSRIVNGWIKPTPAIKHRIAESLQVDMNELFPNSESEADAIS